MERNNAGNFLGMGEEMKIRIWKQGSSVLETPWFETVELHIRGGGFEGRKYNK